MFPTNRRHKPAKSCRGFSQQRIPKSNTCLSRHVERLAKKAAQLAAGEYEARGSSVSADEVEQALSEALKSSAEQHDD